MTHPRGPLAGQGLTGGPALTDRQLELWIFRYNRVNVAFGCLKIEQALVGIPPRRFPPRPPFPAPPLPTPPPQLPSCPVAQLLHLAAPLPPPPQLLSCPVAQLLHLTASPPPPPHPQSSHFTPYDESIIVPWSPIIRTRASPRPDSPIVVAQGPTGAGEFRSSPVFPLSP